MIVVKSMDPLTVHQWMAEGKALLIDVREKPEYDEEHIPGSVFIPLSGFETELVPPAEGRILVFQCRSGMRSEQACRAFLDVYPDQEAYNLQGGILSWKKEGLPTSQTTGGKDV